MHYGGRLEGPRPFLHPFPVETRWTNQITSFSSLLIAFLVSSPSSLFLFFLPVLSLSLFLRLSSLAVSPSFLLYLSLFLPPLSRSSSLPHYPTHNRTPRARKKDATALARHRSFAAYTRSRSAVCNLNIIHRKACEKSYQSHSHRHFSSQVKL